MKTCTDPGQESAFFRIRSYEGEGEPIQRFKEHSPVSIVLETVHPEDEEQNIVISLFDTDSCRSISLSRDNRNNPLYRKGLHYHDFFEICYVIKGEMYQNIEHKRHLYPEGSICLLNQNIRHTEEFSTDFRCLFAALSAPLVRELFLQADNFYFSPEKEILNSPITSFFFHNLSHSGTSVREYMDFILLPDARGEKESMYRRFDLLLKQFLFPMPGSTYLVKSALLQIFAALIDTGRYHTVPVSIGTEKETRIFDRITQLLYENHGRLSRGELESAMNYHGAYLNKIIKKYTGLNLFQYGMTICMKEACRLLAETDLPVTQIADILKFSNRTHFYKIFEETFGTTPRRYRISHRNSRRRFCL